MNNIFKRWGAALVVGITTLGIGVGCLINSRQNALGKDNYGVNANSSEVLLGNSKKGILQYGDIEGNYKEIE